MPKTSIIALLLTLLLTSYVQAGLMLSFSQPNATITVGQSIDVDLILTQSGNITGTDITNNGITLADIQLSLDTAAATVIAITAGPGFMDSLIGSNPSTPLMSIESIDLVNGVLAPSGSPTSIVLGTFTFLGNSVGTTTATTVNEATLTDFVFAATPSPNQNIDNLIFGTESFTVNVEAIPEPSSMTIVSAAICGLVARKLRSHRKRISTI